MVVLFCHERKSNMAALDSSATGEGKRISLRDSRTSKAFQLEPFDYILTILVPRYHNQRAK